jgi:signal transduction histidine kinase
MLDQLSIGVAQFDPDQRLFFANQPFQRLFHLTAADIEQAPDFDRFLDSARTDKRLPETRDFPAWRAQLREWFTAGEAREEAWTLPGGTHLRMIAQPMPDGGLVLVAEDRTEQMSLSAIRDTLLRTRTAIFDSLFESLAVIGPDGRLQTWNRSFASVWGLESDFLDTHPRLDAVLEKLGERLARPGRAAAIGETVRAATLDRKQRGGRVELADGRVLEFAGVPLPDGNGLLTVLDITDSQKAEAALRERNQALEEADKVKTRFLANMSYEFRTPLTSIGGFAEMLQAGIAGDLSDQGQDYVGSILASVQRLTEQIETVLDLSQSEAGLMPLEREQVALFPLVTRTVRKREDRIASGGLSLDLRGSDTAAGRVNADARRLEQAIGHLLDNAIAATDRGGKILVDISRAKGAVRIVISDNGKGMSDDELSAALGNAPGADVGVKRQGLGIPLARQLIEAHGGSLEIMSQAGLGTPATIVLP